MGKLTLAFAAVLALAASSAWAQDPGQPPVPAENAAPPPAPVPGTAQPPKPAQNAAPPAVPSRYSFNPVNDGFLRLDNQTGQVALCSPHMARWVCQAAPEESAALEKEIARLQDEITGFKQEVAGLKQEIANLRAPPPPPRPPADLTPPGKDNSAQLREDLGRARVALSNAWRRFVDLVVSFQKDMLGKG
jgi:hypothetical protein